MDGDQCSGQESSLLLRVAIDRVINEILADAAVIQERVSLGRRTIAGDGLAIALCLDQEFEQVALYGSRFFIEAQVQVEPTDPKAFFLIGQLRNAAKERFIEQLGTALQKYGQATAGQTPAKLADVASYFSPPVELNVLERYELIPQRDIPNVRLSQNPDELIVREKRALDPAAGETVQLINLKGTARGAIGDTRTLATPKP